MCDPVSATVAVVGTGLRIAGDVAQHKAEEKQSKAVARAARRDEKLQLYDIGQRAQQEARAASVQIDEINRAGRSAQSAATVGANEAGVVGNSVDLLLGDIERDTAVARLDTQDNLMVTIDQLQRMKQGVRADATNRIEGTSGPSTLATGLKIGSSLLGAADFYIRTRPPSGSDDS